MQTQQVLEFWGKARAEEGAIVAWHPVCHHLLDVAAVAEAILSARTQTCERAGLLLGLRADEAQRLLVALIALHDIGKFAPAFQAIATPAQWSWPTALHGVDATMYGRSVHTADGLLLWRKTLRSEFASRIWHGGERAMEDIEIAIFGHHGRPVEPEIGPLASRFSEGAVAAARHCAELVLRCVLREPVAAPPPSRRASQLASWWVAGFTTIADWIGSRAAWFPYTAPLADDDTLESYWEKARQQAKLAVRAAGLTSIMPAPSRSFLSLTGKTLPTPTQDWAANVVLPDGPVLAIIEDATGSGKTEAAQMLVHRLMSSGRASGAYWAMPTQATANAMYGRQRTAISALFAPDADRRPSLTLGHGQARLHDGFRRSVIREAQEAIPREHADGRNGDDPADVACAAFLADDRRAALLADVGAGTVDQALLGVLPSRFSAIRLFGLSEKVLVLDEVHAFDAYMSTEVAQLLRFHAALGGSAILLSATLPEPRRRQLERAWHGGNPDEPIDDVGSTPSAYPLATLVGSADPVAVHAAPNAASWTVRRVPLRQVHTEDEALEYVLRVARAGACVVWIRNTVDQCLNAATLIEARGESPLVFHARFAQGDRQRIEAEVMRRFGPKSTNADREGRILLATQVVEQSLDLDFDAMVSDLAPIDLLIQRAGRLWRHERSLRPASLTRELVVLSPPASIDDTAQWLKAELPNTRYVYPDVGVLWRTARLLGADTPIDAPGNLRALIRQVYEGTELPAAMQSAADQAEGVDRANSAIADYTVLALNSGYVSGRAWTDDLRARTRLGEEQVAIRLARVANGALVPWHENELPEWKRWMLSEVKLSAKRVAWNAAPVSEWERRIDNIRAGWGRYEQQIPVVVLESGIGGVWNGTTEGADKKKTMSLVYSGHRGMEYG